MKALNIFYPLTLLFFIVACKSEIKPEEKVALKEKIQTIEVSIEGMTCEIGCAKLIESKVHKLEGVTLSKVNFEEKTGQFSFDSNKISEEEIVKNINGIAGGELYKVTSSKTVK